MSRRRAMGGSSGSYNRGTGADQVGPPPPASSVSNSFPKGQPSAAGVEISNPIKPGGSLHMAGQLHVSGPRGGRKGKMPKYNP